jgi:3-dehydroquinate synthase
MRSRDCCVHPIMTFARSVSCAPRAKRNQGGNRRCAVFNLSAGQPAGLTPGNGLLSCGMRNVSVPLGARSYTIRIDSGLLAGLGRACQRLKLGRRCAVISDQRVAPLYGEKTMTSLRKSGFDPILVTVPAGERAKNLRVVAGAHDRLAAHRLERRSFVVALGGGVVGDLAGFVAATHLRGIDYVQVPTTLLAQVDSSVGGKVGVNLAAGKNLVGAFHQPRLVVCDLDTLETLPDREYRSGLAEVIKYGIISDPALFARLERQMPSLLERDRASLKGVVARCCEIKARVVSQDEQEGGLRAILNFGHTIGHALEAVSRYGRFLHGEAIAIGQVLAARLSARLFGLPAFEAERIERLLICAGLPTQVRLTELQREALLDAMRHDKKVVDADIRFVLAERIGRVRFDQTVSEQDLNEILGTLQRTRGAIAR